jgi:GT2 family glycosyltransferase
MSERGHDAGVRASVIIPAHDAASTLADQLQALASQEVPFSWEVIVVDNGSADDTASVAAGYHELLPNLRVISDSDGRGGSYARNIGVAHAEADLLLFCDADDAVAPGWVEAMVAGLEEYDAVGGQVDELVLTNGVSRAIRGRATPGKLPVMMGFLPRAVGANFAVRRDVFEAVGGFDTTIPRSHDTELSFRIQVAGYRLGYVPESLVYYRHRPDAAANLRQAYQWAQARPLLYRRYRSHGMPRSHGLRRVGSVVLRSWWLVAGRARRLRWLGMAARLAGRVVGSVRHRVWYV